jgi:hypothetical protein
MYLIQMAVIALAHQIWMDLDAYAIAFQCVHKLNTAET